jgi:hypothetical protein
VTAEDDGGAWFTWDDSRVPAKPSDWITANPALDIELLPWQLAVLDELYKNPGVPLIWPPTAPARRRPYANEHWVIIDEIVEWMKPTRIDEARQHLIDEISADVDAKIARLQCPRFPRVE